MIYSVWRGSGEQLISIQRDWSVDDVIRVASYLEVEAMEAKMRQSW
jgi:gentisate 1,2-dioxygenase